MFVGHLAVGLAAKRVAPAINLGWLIAGTTLLDLIWPLFLITGIEQAGISPGATAFTPLVFESYPWSHSLAMTAFWGLVLVAVSRAARVPSSASMLLFALVVSHWVLDFVTHAPDMALWPGDSTRFGLSLWNSIPATIVVEGAMWIAAIVMYVRTRAGQGERPGWPFWSFIVVCTVMWITSPFSPPPPNVTVLEWFSLVGLIVVPWAVWADRTSSGAKVRMDVERAPDR